MPTTCPAGDPPAPLTLAHQSHHQERAPPGWSKPLAGRGHPLARVTATTASADIAVRCCAMAAMPPENDPKIN
eukprot:CAMPEP_0204273766 /NCGR_PEP_ID=MMETSP0468-20130131/24283_1 /ASSEMBLY_ACC=CAM_ASM_000383 /TAXON_ID=2969 /ORGANISM="Oxyrrhis marina" /LENGTH=72 /DNA_ID=CAMNT_0051249871 /DNA_START=37 /DNA_END=255 /DNA_ORIENTATION=-